MVQEIESKTDLLKAYLEKRDPEVFKALYEEYAGFVYSICLRHLRNHQDAEDAVTACFVILHEKASVVKSGRLMAWLHACAVRTSMNTARLRLHRVEREQEAYDMNTIEHEGKTMNWDAILPLVEQEMANLPADQKEMLLLHYYSGLSRTEIARQVGVPEGTVAWKIGNAIGKLRNRLASKGHEMNAESFVAGMAGSALILPVPYSLTLKLAAIAKGGTLAATVSDIVGSTLKGMFWAKAKVAAGIAAAVVCGVAVPAAVVTSMLSVAPPMENNVVSPEASPSAESQVEIIYEDHFSGAKLDAFWERVEPTNQVMLADPGYKSALVLRASGAGAREKFKPVVALVSRGVDVTRDILEVTFTERRPYVTGNKMGQDAALNGTYLCDDSGNNLNVEPYPENPAVTVKSSPSVITMAGDYEDSVSKIFVFANGDALALGKDASFWGRVKDKPKSVRLKIILEISDPTASATWPVDRVTVRRLKSLPEDAARVLAVIRAGTKTVEMAGVREDSSGQKKQK